MSLQVAIGSAFLVVCLGWSYLFVFGGWVRRWSFERSLSSQATRVERIALAASQDDERFAPGVIRAAVDTMIAWAVDSPEGLAEAHQRPDGVRLRAWARLHGLTDAGQSIGRVTVQFVRVSNLGEGRQLIELRVRGKAPRDRRGVRANRRRIDERWTLRLIDGRWILDGYGPAALLKPLLHSAQIASPVDDEQHLHADALRELALEDESDAELDGLVSSDLDPALQVQDLATVDGRFATDVVENALRGLIEAWQQPQRLRSTQPDAVGRASPEAVLQLLRATPDDDLRVLVVADAELEHWKIVGVDLIGDAPRIAVDVTVIARRYLAPRTGRDVPTLGSTTYRHAITMRWTLELNDHAPELWQLITTTNPTSEIPGALP